MRKNCLIALCLLLAPVAGVAHPRLVSTMPSTRAPQKAVARIQLLFSEQLVAPLSRADVVRIGPDATRGGLPLPVRTSLSGDGKTLVLALAHPLSKGHYRVDWTVVSADTHRAKGQYSFLVR